MIFITSEAKATKIFKKYKNVVAFSFAKNPKAPTFDDPKLKIEYEAIPFLPSEDDINAVKAGDLKLKKVIKEAIKALNNPKAENALIGVGMTQFVNLLAIGRKSKNGPTVIVFIKDENDEQRTKILTKYVEALIAEYGLKAAPNKMIKKLFKGKKKKVIKAVAGANNAKGNVLNNRGNQLKKMNMIFYEVELRQASLSNISDGHLSRDEAKSCIKGLLEMYTGNNLEHVSKKVGKRLAKRDKNAVKAYKDLRAILRTIDPDLKAPKVDYGHKRKGKKVGKVKMDIKKFASYYEKGSHRGALLLIYGHTVAILSGLELGSSDYNKHMKGVCKIFDDGLDKAYLDAVKAYAKANGTAA